MTTVGVWGVWTPWVLAAMVAFGVGGSLGTTLGPSRDVIVTGYVSLSASLILAGGLQWLVLRRLVAGSGLWVPASLAAVAVTGLVVFGLGRVNADVGWVLGVVVGWVALGALQWLVLRPEVAGAGWWVPANALGLIVAIPVVALVTWMAGAPPEGSIGNVLRWLAFGGAYGVVTGTALWLLLRGQLGLPLP